MKAPLSPLQIPQNVQAWRRGAMSERRGTDPTEIPVAAHSIAEYLGVIENGSTRYVTVFLQMGLQIRSDS